MGIEQKPSILIKPALKLVGVLLCEGEEQRTTQQEAFVPLMSLVSLSAIFPLFSGGDASQSFASATKRELVLVLRSVSNLIDKTTKQQSLLPLAQHFMDFVDITLACDRRPAVVHAVTALLVSIASNRAAGLMKSTRTCFNPHLVERLVSSLEMSTRLFSVATVKQLSEPGVLGDGTLANNCAFC